MPGRADIHARQRPWAGLVLKVCVLCTETPTQLWHGGSRGHFELQPVGQGALPKLVPSRQPRAPKTHRESAGDRTAGAEAVPSEIHLALSLHIAFQISASSRKPTGSAPFSKRLLPCQQTYSHGSGLSSWEQGCLEEGSLFGPPLCAHSRN